MITAPVELLRDVHIVDTPGTNAIIREHERLTTEFVPRSDLVLFVTSADRPFTETERAFLETIRDWGKKIVIVVNKIDIFGTPAELDEVLGVRASAPRASCSASTPTCLPVSARLAQRAKHGEPALWAASRFEALERYLHDDARRPQPLPAEAGEPARRRPGARRSAMRAIAARAADAARTRTSTCSPTSSGSWPSTARTWTRGFELRMAAVEKELVDMEARGHRYFEDTLRIGRVVDLLNRARVQKEFEERGGRGRAACRSSAASPS